MTDVPADHDARVASIAAAIRDRIGRGAPVHISKGGVHHVVPLPGDRRFEGDPIDISGLRAVLAIDPVARTCVAEPGVTFAELVRKTLDHGLLPTVVPELEGITAGGAVAGCSVESMSHLEGGFHDSCLEYEVVTGDGRILVLRPDDPLFHMIHGSYGTLAILTKLTFRLVAAKPYVQLVYETHTSTAAFDAALKRHCAERRYALVDGIVHGPEQLVLCLGNFTDEAPPATGDLRSGPFYRRTAGRTGEHLTTFDYCFRYDADCHWLTRALPPLEWGWVRALFGRWYLGSTNLIRWSAILEPVLGLKRRPDVVVDVFIPGRNFLAFLDWYVADFRYWPLWIVPYRIPTPYPWIADDHAAGFGGDLFVDCAVYGRPNGDPDVDWSRVLEERTYALGGIKTLISANHHTPEQFWRVYDRPRYEAAKAALDPHGVFRGIYEKFHR